MHGGSIEVASVEGEGATFVVHLPRNPQSDEQG
jgi:signal transduction histidine kinase